MKFFTKSVGISLSSFHLGWFVFPQENVDILGHDGGTEGFSSFMCMNLENQLACCYSNKQSNETCPQIRNFIN